MSSSQVFIQVSDVVAQLNATGPDGNNNYTVYGLTISSASLQAHVNYANDYIYSIVGGTTLLTSDPRYPVAVDAAKNLAALRVLVVAAGGSLTGAYDYFLGDLRVTRSGPYATALKMTIQGFKEDLVKLMVNLSTAVKTGDVQYGNQTPAYKGGLAGP
jgi:hypothetical protein